MSLRITPLPKDILHHVVPTIEPFYVASDFSSTKLNTSSNTITYPLSYTHLETFIPNSFYAESQHIGSLNSPLLLKRQFLSPLKQQSRTTASLHSPDPPLRNSSRTKDPPAWMKDFVFLNTFVNQLSPPFLSHLLQIILPFVIVLLLFPNLHTLILIFLFSCGTSLFHLCGCSC